MKLSEFMWEPGGGGNKGSGKVEGWKEGENGLGVARENPQRN